MLRRTVSMVMICGLALAIPAAAHAAPVYVADNGAGAVLKLNPHSGHVSVLSNDPLLGSPGGITLARDGTLLVSDFQNGPILRVDPDNGDTTVVADTPGLVTPFDLEQVGKRKIYVADEGTPGILDVDPLNGNVGIFSGGTARYKDPFGVATGHHGKLYVADDAKHRGSILEVAKSAHVSVLAKGKPLDTPTGLEMGPDNQLYVADYDAGPHDTGAILRVDPTNGHVHTVRSGPPIDETYGLDLDRNGNIYAAEAPNAKGKPVIHRMNSTGGDLKTFKDPLFNAPYGVVVGR